MTGRWHQGQLVVCDEIVKMPCKLRMSWLTFTAWRVQSNRPILTWSQAKAASRPMFVRAVWRSKRPFDIKQALREMAAPSPRNADVLGLCAPDFTKMTRGLFDR
jgi:hypothetical protein